MEEFLARAAISPPDLGAFFAPAGLSETDCLNVTGWLKSLAPAWGVHRHEDAFDQPSLIMAPVNADRLQRALIVYRIGRRWFLGEVANGAYQEAPDFGALRDLLEAVRDRLGAATSVDNHLQIETASSAPP